MCIYLDINSDFIYANNRIQPNTILIDRGKMEDLRGIALLMIFWAVFTTVFWMVVSWRAMRALEQLANSVKRIARQQTQRPDNPDHTLNQD